MPPRGVAITLLLQGDGAEMMGVGMVGDSPQDRSVPGNRCVEIAGSVRRMRVAKDLLHRDSPGWLR